MADAKRVENELRELSAFTEQSGKITRQTFSDAWICALVWVKQKMEEAKMTTRVDGFGNLIGTYVPAGAKGKPVGIGSHIDTVIDGGAYDGAVGIISGLEIIRTLREENISLPFPIEVIAFAEEEGGVFGKGCLGSEYMTAHTPLEKLSALRRRDGTGVATAADRAPFDKPAFGSDYGWAREHFRTFFEIHAEQGPIMYETGKTLGIVEGVVGILRTKITFLGHANHAGTTRMRHRKDAVAALSDFVLRTYRYALAHDGELVITNGKIEVFPNQHNVVPGVASTMMEMRAAEDRIIQCAHNELVHAAHSAAEEYRLAVRVEEPVYVAPVNFDAELFHLAREIYSGREDVMPMFSWAGHDAKLMATVAPAMMLFVPSRDGMSHCPEEYSDPADVAQAADFLIELMRKMKADAVY